MVGRRLLLHPTPPRSLRMNRTHLFALMDGAGGISLFPSVHRRPGSPELITWRLAGMTLMFLLLLMSLILTVGLVLRGVPDGVAVIPYLGAMGLLWTLQWRHARVPPV